MKRYELSVRRTDDQAYVNLLKFDADCFLARWRGGASAPSCEQDGVTESTAAASRSLVGCRRMRP